MEKISEKVMCQHCNKAEAQGPYKHGRVWFNYKLCRACYEKWSSCESLCEIIADSLQKK